MRRIASILVDPNSKDEDESQAAEIEALDGSEVVQSGDAGNVDGDEVDQARHLILFIASPSGTGKSTCILPAFLASEFQYYMPIAHSNNGGRRFRLKRLMQGDQPQVNVDDDFANDLGAAFMCTVVRNFLNDDCSRDTRVVYPYTLKVVPTAIEKQADKPADVTGDAPCPAIPSREYSAEFLKAMLNEYFGGDATFLFHTDEHRKMYEDSAGRPHVSRGAMTLLAEAPRTQVIATYIDQLDSLPTTASTSGVCRLPVALPKLDVQGMLEAINAGIDKFGAPNMAPLPIINLSQFQELSAATKRYWITYYFRLASSVVEDLRSVHYFIDDFNRLKTAEMSFVDFKDQHALASIAVASKNALAQVQSCLPIRDAIVSGDTDQLQLAVSKTSKHNPLVLALRLPKKASETMSKGKKQQVLETIDNWQLISCSKELDLDLESDAQDLQALYLLGLTDVQAQLLKLW